MARMSPAVRALLLIPLTLAALASTPAFADTIIIRQPPRVIVVQPPPPVYYGHWGYGPRPYYYYPHAYYGYGYPHRPHWGGGWRGQHWR